MTFFFFYMNSAGAGGSSINSSFGNLFYLIFGVAFLVYSVAYTASLFKTLIEEENQNEN